MATVLDSVALDIGFYPLSFGGCVGMTTAILKMHEDRGPLSHNKIYAHTEDHPYNPLKTHGPIYICVYTYIYMIYKYMLLNITFMQFINTKFYTKHCMCISAYMYIMPLSPIIEMSL